MITIYRPLDYGSLDIMPERAWCLPGEYITGVVMLHLNRSFEETDMSITLVGHEAVNAVHKDSDGDKVRQSTNHLVVSQRIQLGRGPLAAGDIAVPFVIPVPLELPPTKDAHFLSDTPGNHNFSDLRVTIAYTLKCQLIVRDVSPRLICQDIPFSIAAFPAVHPMGEPREASATRTFRYACLTKEGSCALRVAVPTDVVSVGMRLSAHVWLALSPRERLRHVTLSLCRIIKTSNKKLRVHDGTKATLCTTRFDRMLLRDTAEFVLQVPVDESSAPQREGKRQTLPFHPTETFRDFRVTYEIVVECDARGCKPVVVRFPVTFMGYDNGDATAVATLVA